MFLKLVERSQKVQLRATIMFQMLEKLLCSGGFTDLNLFSLSHRGSRGDLIIRCKHFHTHTVSTTKSFLIWW